MSDSAQDFLEDLGDIAVDARLERIKEIIERTVADPLVIMRDYVPEEILVAVSVVAATIPAASPPEFFSNDRLLDVIQGMAPQASVAHVASLALQAVMDYNDSWIISSLKDEGDRRSALRELLEVKAILDADNDGEA